MFTEISGSSAVFDRGFITYSNEAKCKMLGIDIELLANHGAVSQQVAEAMAVGAINNSLADISVSVTGVAGPTGGTPEKPVGLVFIATATRAGYMQCRKFNFNGTRTEVSNANCFNRRGDDS